MASGYSRRLSCLTALFVVWALSGFARAEEQPSSESKPAPSEKTEKPREKPRKDKREVPNYDGRDPEPKTAGDVLLWVPRVALFPVYVVSEYILRRPLGYIVTKAEKEEWPALIVDFFTFGPERNAGIVPTGMIDFGLRPSIGVYAFWNGAIIDDNEMRLRLAWGGANFVLADFTERYRFAQGETLALRLSHNERPDWRYHGLGDTGDQSADAFARYRKAVSEVGVRAESGFYRSSTASLSLGVRRTHNDGSTSCCDNQTVNDAAQAGILTLPPGMNDKYTASFIEADVALDTRLPRKLDAAEEGSDFVSPPGSGMRLDLRARHGYELSGDTRAHWLAYGASLGGFVDLTDQQRVVGVTLITDFIESLSDDVAIPFTELITLGGFRPLQGFLADRFFGDSSIVLRTEYRWPVWVWLDGVAHYSVGRVFPEHLRGFELRKLRSSFGTGFRANNSYDHTFQFLLAFGTEPFDSGGQIETVRLVIGTTAGF